VVVEPRDGSRPLVRALDAARRSIFVEIYILSDHGIMRALERAAAQGVAVHVLLEHHPFGMGRQPESAADRLRAAGVAVRWSSPAFLLTHAKTVLIDGTTAVISTANFSHAGMTEDRDFMVWDHNRRDVHALDALLRDDWDRLPSSPGTKNLVIAPDDARRRLRSLITAARVSLDVYGEEMQDPETQRLLVKVACRGTRVRVLLPSRPRRGAAVLRRGCVRIRTLDRPYVHAKAFIVDGRRGFIGSENMSAQSLDRNREVGVLIRGRAVRGVARTFNRDWRRALPLPRGES
jgi:phosphatidylserine/phosphatidylglycerophosphate/cardiolipin synthase-like enzyme